MSANVLNTDLTGKVAVVTGAGGVLCSTLAKVLARAGAKVALLNRTAEKAEKVAAEIAAEGGTAKAYACNVLDKERCFAVADQVLQDFGPCDILLNGEKISDDWFAPGSEEYATEMPYQVYDVTELLQNGANALGVQLAEGWWSGYQTYIIGNYGYYGAKQALLSKLDITYGDGSVETFVSAPDSWQVYNHGPVEYASNFHGERYNAVTAAAMEEADRITADTNVKGFTSLDELFAELKS